MIDLSAIWSQKRIVHVSGTSICVPFGVDLDPYLVDFLTRWIRENGFLWTSEKLKSLKVWAYQILAGNHNYSLPWFSKIHYKGFLIPKLSLFKYLVDHLHNLKKVKLVLIILNSYKLKLCGEPSLSSIIGVPRSLPSINYIPHLRRYVSLPRVPQFALEGTVACNTKSFYCDDFGNTREGPYGLYDSDFPAEIALTYQDMNENPFCIGKLIPIPDKGKFRTILVGNSAVQLKTKKLADWLRSYLWNLPEIASGDQAKMSRFVLQSFKEGKTISSIDLSNATDRLSVDLQTQLLISMGVPRRYFSFLFLPFFYEPKQFGRKGPRAEARYSNGQPMGLFVSFPMFELAHYCILKYAVATSKAAFCICGDDVVVSSNASDAPIIFNRYKNLIERFGGEISEKKTMISETFAEGIGAIFLKDYPMEIRIPSGKLSALEAFTSGTWVSDQIKKETPLGRALLYSWLSTKEWKEYNYDHRRNLNELITCFDLSDWKTESLQALATHEDYPQRWLVWEVDPHLPLMKKEGQTPFRWVSQEKFRDALVSHKVITLYKKDVPK
jgi:hypothetical protein